ncbi:MAG: PAC2 family protein [Chloroflexi bacterium]|nr:PAC2 family protein [Chloroflexota bacterium]
MSALKITHVRPLRNPILLMAFEGWNDAGEAASTVARIIISQRNGDKIASIDPEEFFVFTDTRPYVRISRRGRRRIEWPSNEFFVCPDPRSGPEAHDLVVLRGTEPDLRWRTFTSLVLEVAKRCGVELVVALGALYGDVPHTLPVRVTGSALNAERHSLLRELGFKPSRYQGPTGIISVLTNRFAEAGYPVASIWGWAPHYISATPNPSVAATMLGEVRRVLDIPLDSEMLDEAAEQFDEQVRDAVSKDPEAMAYVQDLENQAREEETESTERNLDRARRGGELPSGAAMVDALEEFLRSRRRPPRSSE